MTIENRELPIGTILTARYKGDEYSAELAQTDAGPRYRLTDGREFKSPSAAGTAIIQGACNGWVFWSIAGSEKPKRDRKASIRNRNVGLNDSYGCGECPSTFPTIDEATAHVALEHRELIT